jgi:hypothetical protein
VAFASISSLSHRLEAGAAITRVNALIGIGFREVDTSRRVVIRS